MNKLRQTITTLSILVIVSLLSSQTIFSDSNELRESDDYYSQRDVLTNDAGTGQDAGSNISTAITIQSENVTFSGDVSNPNDRRDVYLITPPKDYFICIELTWEGSVDLDLGFGDNTETGNFTKSSRYGGDYNPEAVTHTNDYHETLFFVVDLFDEDAIGLFEYQISILIDSTPRINAICQDDAGYGRDAYSGYGNHTEIFPTSSPGITTINGYLSYNEDEWDTYHVEVPDDKGLEIRLYCNQNLVDMKISMFQISNYGSESEDVLDF